MVCDHKQDTAVEETRKGARREVGDRHKGRLPAEEVTEAEMVHPSWKQTCSVSQGQYG